MYSPRFTISNKVINNLARIEALKMFLEQARLLPKQELSFKKKAAIRMAQSSTSIEGNVLNEGEVEKVFMGKATSAPAKDELEVENYQRAISLINKAADKKRSLSNGLVLEAHKILMAGLLPPKKLGKFRTGPVYVVNAYPTHDEIVYTAPKANKIEGLIESLLTWLGQAESRGLSPIIRAALLHHEIAAIHPFSDGNGRVARLLTTYFLYLNKYEIRRIYTLDTFYNRDRQKYYAAIRSGKIYSQSKRYNLTAWLEYFTEGFVWELSRIKDQVSALRIKPSREVMLLEKDLLRLLDYLATMGKITSSEVEDILKIPKRTAQSKLKKMLDLELVKKVPRGPKTYYIIA